MRTFTEIIEGHAYPFDAGQRPYAALLKLIDNANLVLLGAQTHGTHEFYQERANITKNLIEQNGFNAVVIEADWPDACRVDSYIRGQGGDAAPDQALAGLADFPGWLWRNVDMLTFLTWLRTYNSTVVRPEKKVRFYGMDLFGLHKSINALIEYLHKVDPPTAQQARVAYACVDRLGEEVNTCSFAARLGLDKACEDAALKELIELQTRRHQYTRNDWPDADDELFSAEQNARSIGHMERYYRAMFNERTLAWNLRERHMAESLAAMLTHITRRCGQAKLVVWSHNRHVGDGRAATTSYAGIVSLGELVRKQLGPGAVLVGFTTHSGTLTCASDWWASPPHQITLNPAVDESYEAAFRGAGHGDFMLNLRDMNESAKESLGSKMERAVGIIYRPESERKECYFEAQLGRQFDAIVHLDQTRAVEPLGLQAEREKGEMPETFPVGV